ncbi:GNAT family N-acetyltransferase [Cryptosporangium aurantiacum]|uniref:Protein N-acetyltransferase, RimJ/RimL family n=1 Tax=Cryptosporangium aurantiacum TaxID=134849 RepID=A0A1M7IZY4_9ACTN|nr:GNAT family protein [Cryptosporangium aurantiacum]SHM46404.1 Protein N-acetyltransferase, RimJ/RimL family [Cryptosporangium aurantiacum]
MSAGDAAGFDSSLWPLAQLRVRAGAIELRPPTDDDLPALAALVPVEAGHDPTLPISGVTTPHEVTAQAVLRQVWRSRAELAPDRWRICLAAYVDGVLVGQQDLKADDFPRRRIVETSSWLGTEHRRRGHGKAMRALALHLAFEGLGAVAVESESAEGNDAALGITRSLGYSPSGDTYEVHDGVVTHMLWSRLTRERWALHRQGYGLGPVECEGVEGCRQLLGLPPTELAPTSNGNRAANGVAHRGAPTGQPAPA